MLPPDLVGCPEHGSKDWKLYKYRNGRTEQKCLACARERSAKHHNNGPRCRRGHLKTPWSWRRYGKLQWGRCLTCQYNRRRERKRERAA